MTDLSVTITAGVYRWPLSPGLIWRHKEIIYRFVLRELSVRYRQTTLGMSWALLQPLLVVLLFSLIFGRTKTFSSVHGSYFGFCLIGVVVWTYFSNCLLHGANSLLENRELICQTYFPRAFLPLAVILSKLSDLGIGFTLLLGWYVYEKPITDFTYVWMLLPLMIFFAAFVIGLTLFVSAACVQFPDLRYVVPFVLQLLMFSSPVVYPLSILPEGVQWLARLNPLAIWIETLRHFFGFGGSLSIGLFMEASFISVSILLCGLIYFRSIERGLADIV